MVHHFGPLVKRLRLQPLTLASPVRFWYGSPLDCTSLVQSFVWTISSVGQSVRLITGRSRVRVPDGPPGTPLTSVKGSVNSEWEEASKRLLLHFTAAMQS